MSNNRRLAVNMIWQIISFIISSCISFFLTSYIVNKVSAEAYGFVGLALNFVSYAQLVTIALNSMAGRFITVKVHQKDYEGANKYFTSVMYANIFLAFFVVAISLILIANLNKVVNISNSILTDVKILWLFIFINFALSLIEGTYGIATFTSNRLDLTSFRNIQSSLLKAFLLLFMYLSFNTKVWYLGFVSMICTIYVLLWDMYYTKKLLPDIKVKRKYFNVKAIINVVSSGIWNTITKIGQLLSTGIDLLITNWFIGAREMGVLSLAKTIPSLISNICGLLAGVFAPAITIAYAKGDSKELLKNIKMSMKLMGIVVNIPIALLIVYGDIFYKLWVPKEDSRLLQVLSIITILYLVIECNIMSIYHVFTALNKVKENSLSVLIQGILNGILVIVLLKVTNLGIIVVACVSTILSIIRNLIFTVPYASKILNLKFNYFFKDIIISIISVIVISISSFIIRSFSFVHNWSYISLIISGSISGIIAFIINIFIFLNNSEKKALLNIIISKVKKGKKIYD